MTGSIFTHKDVETYFKRISVTSTASYFKPMSKKRIIQFLLQEFAKCFTDDKSEYKKQELLILADSIDLSSPDEKSGLADPSLPEL